MLSEGNFFFSVIIPTYNRAAVLDRCLASLVKQTFKNFEVIICDDGSKDHTQDVVKQYHGQLAIQYSFNENWGGPARPRNNGIALARAEWVCFLDSDDWWYDNKLAVIAPFCRGDYDFVYHNFDLYRKGELTKKKLIGRQLQSPAFEDLFVNDNCIVNSGAAVRKQLLQTAGGFSEERELIAVEDYDLWLKCARLTERFRYIPECLGGYDVADDNITATDNRQLKRIEELYKRHVGFVKDEFALKQANYNWSYKRGLIYSKMKAGKQARSEFLSAVRSKNRQIKVKAGIRFFQSLLK